MACDNHHYIAPKVQPVVEYGWMTQEKIFRLFRYCFMGQAFGRGVAWDLEGVRSERKVTLDRRRHRKVGGSGGMLAHKIFEILGALRNASFLRFPQDIFGI